MSMQKLKYCILYVILPPLVNFLALPKKWVESHQWKLIVKD